MNRLLQFSILLVVAFTTTYSYSQTNFNVNVEGLMQGDSAIVIMQKSSEVLIKKWAVADSLNSTIELDFSLGNGLWALKVEAIGYTFPSSKVINVPEDSSAEVTFTKLLEENYKYTWYDDESSSGHATQTYVGEPTTIVIMDSIVKVPNDYSSIKLRNEFGIVLSDNIEPWSMEDSYRLYSMLRSLPYNPNHHINFETGEGIRGVFYLTNEEQYKDLNITNEGGLKNATISQSAFTYTSPLVVTVDGIKGRFYSKRLYHTLVNYFTDFGTDADAVDYIANESFGFKFMKSDQETEDLMGEHASNFQEFFAEEKIEILAMFEELPEGFHKQEELKYMVRRINGQDNPIYPDAAAIAWVSNETIEWMSKAFNQVDLPNVHRLILHEKSHFMWEYLFDDTTKEDWIEIGGWFEDPTSDSGWSTYKTTEFVSAYAHSINPDEDMAESIAAYVTNPDILLSRSVNKYEFIRDRIMHGTRYIAQVPEDLTFEVYNLFPDYNYPGKIIGVEVEVLGEAEENKNIRVEFKLDVDDVQLDGASHGYLRLVSSIGTEHDIHLVPESGGVSDILIGETQLSKHAKNGYWVIGSIQVNDNVGNSRYENHSTIGLKLFINNPLEDILPPAWNNDFSMLLVEDHFDSGADGVPVNNEYPDAILMKALKFEFTFYDESPINRAIVRTFFPNMDNPDAELYENQIQGAPIDSTNGYNNDKRFVLYQKIPNYFPSGYYSIPMITSEDVAVNESDVYFMNDISDFEVIPEKGLFAHIRDSIYVQNDYPDYIKPEIDVNNITIMAEPVNPIAPDGETTVELNLLYRDLSDYLGHESGVKEISFNLRDPLGRNHNFNPQNGSATASHRNWTNLYHDLTPANSNEWNSETFKVRLPKGSAPGKWGLVSLDIMDKAGNMRKYSFVEYIRFDIIESDIELTQPLEVEITDKHINAGNVDHISAQMSCSPCEGLDYVYTIYSKHGGGSVVRGEGSFESDTIIVNNINTTGVLDGLVNLTVQVVDSTSSLVATKNAEYLKDVIYPKSYYSQSNIQDQGWSNIDDLIIEIEVESQDVDGEYNLKIFNHLQNESTGGTNSPSEEFGININGSITNENLVVINESNNNDLEPLLDGYLQLSLVVTDMVGNEGSPKISYYQKSNNEIRYVGNEIDPSSCDSVTDIVVTDIRQTTATINWTASSTATSGYEVTIYDSDTDNLVATMAVDSDITSVEVAGLSLSTTYDVFITADCGADITAISDMVNFTTLSCEPVTDVLISGVTLTTATISWITTINPAFGYEIKVYNTDTNSLVYSTDATSDDTNLEIEGLIPSTTYDISITSNCAAEIAAVSEIVSFTTLTPLTITCAPDTILDTDLGVCDYTVVGSEMDPTFTGEGTLTNDLNGTATLAGEVLSIGDTSVVWTVVDEEGQSESCTTIITIEDNEAPEITCASDAILYTEVGSSTYSVVGSDLDATFTDNCTSATITNNFNGASSLANAELPLGTTSVVWTVDDGHGQTATCTTEVTVKEPLTITCAPDITLDTSLGACDYTIVGSEFDATFTGEGTLTNNLNGTATLAGEVLPIGDNLIVWTIVDEEGQSESCTTIITIEDNEAPEITCAPDTLLYTEVGSSSYTVLSSDLDATFTDNCTSAIITNSFNGESSLANAELPIGTTSIVWTVDDGHGQTATCTTEVTVKVPLTITCVPDTIIDTDLGVCDYTVVGSEMDPTFTGEGTLTNNLNGMATLAGEVLSIGDTPVIWTVVDEEGESETCTTIITIEDNEVPEITCASDAILYTEVGSSTYSVVGSDLDATFTDNCTSATITNNFNGESSLANAELPIGTTSIVWTVDDGHSQTASCTTEVIVQVPLSITCAPDTIIDTDLGVCDYTIVGSELDATFTGEGTLTNDLNGTATLAGEVLSIGDNLIVWTIVDEEGQSESCTTIITIEDNEAPEIICPSNQAVNTQPDVPYYIVPDYFDEEEAIAIDNCTTSGIIGTQEPVAGTQLQEGAHLITLTAEDASGNISTCTFELTVNAILGMDDYNFSFKDIEMYPNPADHNIVIVNPSGLSLEDLSIFDLQGRFIYSFSLRDMGARKEMDISKLNSATYFVVIKGEGGQIIKKLIKK